MAADEIVNPDDYTWSGSGSGKRHDGQYDHLMDGQCRKVDRRNYPGGPQTAENLSNALGHRARKLKLHYRSQVLSDYVVLFQVTGKREGE